MGSSCWCLEHSEIFRSSSTTQPLRGAAAGNGYWGSLRQDRVAVVRSVVVAIPGATSGQVVELLTVSRE